MKAFVITLAGQPYSEAKAQGCVWSGENIGGVTVKRFDAVDKHHARQVMAANGLSWTWAVDNTVERVCPRTKLRQRPYGGANLEAKIGCAMSHLLLWRKCVDLREPILILEHDAVFMKALPDFVDFAGICQINDPAGATRGGKQWSESMIRRATPGVHSKTIMWEGEPDGLAGNSAYLIKPHAALALIGAVHEFGVWPNDATICRQLFPYLEEYFPFITRVEQTVSTSSI